MARDLRWFARMENQSAVTGRVIGCAITVHRILGPKLREATYEEALAIEFLEQHVAFERQVTVPVQYKGHWVGHYQIDFIVERQVVVEVESVEHFSSDLRGADVGLLAGNRLARWIAGELQYASVDRRCSAICAVTVDPRSYC